MNTLGCEPYGGWSLPQLLYLSLYYKSSHRQYVKELGIAVPINLYVKKTGGQSVGYSLPRPAEQSPVIKKICSSGYFFLILYVCAFFHFCFLSQLKFTYFVNYLKYKTKNKPRFWLIRAIPFLFFSSLIPAYITIISFLTVSFGLLCFF